MWVCIKYYIPKEYSYVDPLLGNSLRSLVFSLGGLYFLLVVNEVGCKMVNYILRCEANHSPYLYHHYVYAIFVYAIF
jgi:hypothetical protein